MSKLIRTGIDSTNQMYYDYSDGRREFVPFYPAPVQEPRQRPGSIIAAILAAILSGLFNRDQK